MVAIAEAAPIDVGALPSWTANERDLLERLVEGRIADLGVAVSPNALALRVED